MLPFEECRLAVLERPLEHAENRVVSPYFRVRVPRFARGDDVVPLAEPVVARHPVRVGRVCDSLRVFAHDINAVCLWVVLGIPHIVFGVGSVIDTEVLTFLDGVVAVVQRDGLANTLGRVVVIIKVDAVVRDVQLGIDT